MKKKITGFVVTSETIRNKARGLINYLNYLDDPNTPKHKNTEFITVYGHPNEFIKKCQLEALEVDMANQKKGKGGRPTEGLAVSFDFTLPKNTIRPTQEQWKKIGKDLALTLKDNIDGKLKKNHIFMNVHDQSNPHLNMVVSKFMDGKRVRKVDQKALLSKLKSQYNKSVLQHCDFDYRDYEPEEIGLSKKRQKAWQLEQQQQERFLKQFDALVKYHNENNLNRVKTTENRMLKTLDKLVAKEEAINIVKDIKDPDVLNSMNSIIERFRKQQQEMELPASMIKFNCSGCGTEIKKEGLCSSCKSTTGSTYKI